MPVNFKSALLSFPKIVKGESRKPSLFELYAEPPPIFFKDNKRSILDKRTKGQIFHACQF